jgi:hypothetical protein
MCWWLHASATGCLRHRSSHGPKYQPIDEKERISDQRNTWNQQLLLRAIEYVDESLQWLEYEWNLHFEFEAVMEEEPTPGPVHPVFNDLEEDEVDSGVTTG